MSLRMQRVGVHLLGRPGNERTVNRGPDILQLRHQRIEQPRLHIHGASGEARRNSCRLQAVPSYRL